MSKTLNAKKISELEERIASNEVYEIRIVDKETKELYNKECSARKAHQTKRVIEFRV